MSQFFYSITLLTEARVGGFKVVFLVFFLELRGVFYIIGGWAEPTLKELCLL
jgi:hypothetical protein